MIYIYIYIYICEDASFDGALIVRMCSRARGRNTRIQARNKTRMLAGNRARTALYIYMSISICIYIHTYIHTYISYIYIYTYILT